MIGERLGAYEIIEEIGKGGMATVYRAYQANMDRYVAVKVLRRAIADDAALLERFQREARLVARLEHPHLLPIYDYNLTYDPPYIVMRYLEGGTLKEAMKRGRLPLGEIGLLMNQVASALDYAHRQGVVHRDIKPSNVMIDRDGNVFLTDFSIARVESASDVITQTGVTIGTPHYMSPEQAQGLKDVDHRADIYALGVLLFEMVTGELPFNADTVMAIALKHIHEPAPSALSVNAEVSPVLDSVIKRALEKNPDDRFATVTEFAQALATAIAETRGALPGPPRALRAAAQESVQMMAADRLARRAEVDRGTTDSRQTPTEQHKQITVLYANLAECVEIVEMEGAEAARDAMDALWAQFEVAIADQGGTVNIRAPDAITALWGVDVTREDDAERAIHAALAMQAALRARLPKDDEPLPMQIAINTGRALLTPAEGTGAYNATGATVSLVNRLERAAAPGEVLITHDAYRHVRGVFTVEPADPLRIRGRKEPLQTYRVQFAKPRAFRTATREVEGIETRMVGRNAALEQLQDAFYTAVEDEEAQVVTVVSEAGLGKSRLLYEFSNWSELEETTFWRFPGRATPDMAARPYALLRDILGYRFAVQDSDAPAAVREKVEGGVAAMLQKEVADCAEDAHFIGQLLGYDFSDSPHLQGVLGDPQQFQILAQNALDRFFKAALDQNPLVFQLEDIHRADDASLDYLNRLVRENDERPLMLVGLARPELYERRPDWGSGQDFHARLDLHPLSKRDSRRLVREILQKVDQVPKELRDLIVERAEGNPFYIEELIRMLVEDRVIVKGDEAWHVETGRLAGLRVPSTLVGLLQARLDRLLPDERTALGRASVVGRIFWDGAVEALEAGDGLPIDTGAVLARLDADELIHRREESAFADAREYIFNSNMLREVVYDAMLTRQRQVYHKQAADWLVMASGDRADEYALVIAEQYEQAGESAQAAEYLQRAGEQALQLSAFRDALALFERGLALLPEEGAEAERVALLTHIGEVQGWLGAGAEARQTLEEALTLARATRDRKGMAKVLDVLAQVASVQGEYAEAQQHLTESLSLAREVGDQKTLAGVLWGLGAATLRLGTLAEANAYAAESLALAREVGDKMDISNALNLLGVLAWLQGDADEARRFFEECLALALETGNRQSAASALNNLGEMDRKQGNYADARARYRETLAIVRETGAPGGVITIQINLGLVALALDDLDEARTHFHEALVVARASGRVPSVLGGVMGFAGVRAAEGDKNGATEWFGLALHHPAANANVIEDAEPFLEALKAEMEPAAFEAAFERGKALDLEAVVEEILAAFE